MKILMIGLAGTAAAISLPVAAQQQVDSQCANAATQATGYVPGTASTEPPPGQRISGAAGGAAIGAIAGDAGKGAAAGVVAGGVAKRSQRRQNRRADESKNTAWQNSYHACLAQKSSQPHQ
jgi:hypothetical protein